MPPAEIPHRCLESLKKTYDKHFRDGLSPRGVEAWTGSVPAVDLPKVKALFPDLESELKTRALRVLEHRFRIFGIDAAFGSAIDWHLDPKTGRRGRWSSGVTSTIATARRSGESSSRGS